MKKIIIAVSVVLVITVIACSVLIGYHNKYYSIQVSIGRPVEGAKVLREKEKSYFCMPMFAGFGEETPKKNIENMKIATEGIESIYKEITENYETVFIESKYENDLKKGITTITFKGEVADKETGELIPFEQKLNYAFIITKDIQNLPPSESYYFGE